MTITAIEANRIANGAEEPTKSAVDAEVNDLAHRIIKQAELGNFSLTVSHVSPGAQKVLMSLGFSFARVLHTQRDIRISWGPVSSNNVEVI